MASWIVGGLITAGLALAAYTTVKDRKNKGCGCGCSGCDRRKNCH